jgi:histidine triad (HIT) family protein
LKKSRAVVLMLAALVIGVIVGGYLFSDSRPRSFLALNHCNGNCFNSNELLGLVASVGIQKFGALAPSVVKETDKTIVIESPTPQARIHYLVIPKKDMKDIASISDTDADYLLDAIKVAGEIIREQNLRNYRLTTNGPGYQTATYLHFHLTAN